MEEVEDHIDNVSDSTVLLDDYQYNPDIIAAKRRKFAANCGACAPVTSENAAPDDENDTNKIQTDSADSSILGENNSAEYHQWRVNKYFNSIVNVQRANEDVYSSKELKMKRELLKQEANSHQTEANSIEEDIGVIVIEDSDDDGVADKAKDNKDPNSQASSDVSPGPHIDKFSNVSRIPPKPSAINARRATINHSGNNESVCNPTNIQDYQPRLRVLKPAAINARRATIDISELTEIYNRNNNETENLTNNMTVNQTEPGFNRPSLVHETSNAANETNYVIKDSQSNNEARLKHTPATKCDTSKTDTFTDSLAVDKVVKGVRSNPELTSPHQNNINVATQITQHKHIANSGKKDKKKQTNSNEISSLITTNNEFSCNKGVDSTAQLTRGSVSDPSFKNTIPRQEVLNIYFNANEISRKRLSIDITSEEKTKRRRNSIDQSNNEENIKNTETNHTPEIEDVHMETNDTQVFDAPNKNESNYKENNQRVNNTNDERNSKESLKSEEIERVIKLQVDFCSTLKRHLALYCQIHSKESKKTKVYLKSAESLTNEIERLKALSYDRKVKADIQHACPICTRVSTFSVSLLLSNVDNHRHVETNGEKCKYCRRIGSLYNSYMDKFLQEGNNKTIHQVESNINNIEIANENYHITHTPSNTYDHANNRDDLKYMPIKPVEKIPGRESRKQSGESNNIVDSVPEADTLETCIEKDALGHNNNFNLEGVTPSETIVESNKLLESQGNINTNNGNISSSEETNTSVDILEVVTPRERSVLSVSKDNIDDSNSAANSLTKSITSVIGIVSNIDGLDHVYNNKVANNIQDTVEKEAIDTIEKTTCEVTLPKIVSTTIHNDKEDHRGEMPDNLGRGTAHRLTNEEANTFQSTTNVDTPTNLTTDELPNDLRNTSNNSERNASSCIESITSGDGYVISKFFCKKNKESTNLKQNHKRKINNSELKMAFKRVRPNLPAENKNDTETSNDVSAQNSSNNLEDGNESNRTGKKKAHKHTGANRHLVDRRSRTEKISDNVASNECRPEDECEPIRIETTDAHTRNINDASNKSSDNIQQTVEDNEKQSTSNKPNEVSKKTNLEHRDYRRLSNNNNNHEPNNTEYDADTEDQNIVVANKMSDVGTMNRKSREVYKKGEPMNNVHKELLEFRKEIEKNNTGEEMNESANYEARRINETNHEDSGETETVYTDVERNKNSTDESDRIGDESNNTICKTLDESFEKINRNLHMTAPPTPHATNSNVKPHKDLENEVTNQDKIYIKSQVQYMCNICTCVFIYGGRFLHHMILNHNMDLTNIPKQCVMRKCSFCHVFLKENAFNIHVKKYHPHEYLKDADTIKCEKKTKVVEQNNEVQDVRKKELIKKDEKWRYICLICNVTINSYYSARKHRKDKHPGMKNRRLYDKVSVAESTDDEAHKTRGDCDPRNTKKDSGEIFRDGDHDSDESGSEDGSSEHETDEENEKDHDEDSNSEDNCENEGCTSEDKGQSSGYDSDAECDKPRGSESSPAPINEKYQEHTQKSDELSGEENHATANEGNSDSSDESDDDCSGDDEDAECGKDGTNGVNNEVKDVRKSKLIKKDGKWRYICLICNVTINSYYSASKHRKDKHPGMKNRRLYDKVSVDEINESTDDEAHKARGDCDPRNTRKKNRDIFREGEHDSNESCSEDGNSEHETDEKSDKDHDEDSISEDNCQNKGFTSEDKDQSSGDDSDAECDKSSGSESSPPTNDENYQENTQKSDELSGEENHANEDNNDISDESDNDCSGDEVDAECGKDGTTGVNNEVKDVRKSKLIKKDGKWRYICLICNVTINSYYSASKHRRDKHPGMKNRRLYDKVSVDEINESTDDEAHKARGDCDPKNTKRDSREIFRDGEHDSNESGSEGGSTEHESDEETDKDYDEDIKSEDNCRKENEVSSSGNISEDKDNSSGDDSDAECDKSRDSESGPAPINEKYQEHTQKSDEENHATANEDNSDSSDESDNDCSADDVDAECGKDGRTGVNNEVKDVRKSKLIKKDGKWRYICLICNVTINSYYSVSKHRRDKHPGMKNRRLYDKVFVDEINESTDDEAHKARGDCDPRNTRKYFREFYRDGEHDSNESCSEDGNSEHETDEKSDKDQDQDSNSEDNFGKENEKKSSGRSSEDEHDSSGDDSDADCDKSSGSESSPPPIIVKYQENTQKSDESSGDEDHATINEDNCDRSLSSVEDMEYDSNNNSEEASCDEGEIDRHGKREQNVTHQEDTSHAKKSKETYSTNSDETHFDCPDDDVDAECGKDGTAGINLGEGSYRRTKLLVKELNAPRESKKHASIKFSKVKYSFECTICELTLNSLYAVHKHRKEKHPDLKHKKKFIDKKVMYEYVKPNIGEKIEHFNCEKVPTTRAEYCSDLYSCSDTYHTDENNSDSEYDVSEKKGEEKKLLVESGQRIEEDVDENSDSEPEASKNDDSSDANNEENDGQDIMNKIPDDEESGNHKNKKCDANSKTGTIHGVHHGNACNNLQSGNQSKRSKILIYTYECTACEVTLDSGYAVRKHRRDVHPDEKNKKLIRKSLTIAKNQQDVVQSNDEELQRTGENNTRKYENIMHDTSNEHINSDNMHSRNDVNMSRRDQITEQCTHKINEKTQNPSINDHIEDKSKNERIVNYTTDRSTKSSTAKPPSDHETLNENQMRLNKIIDKNVDQDNNAMNSIENNKNQSAHNAYKCLLCNYYFQSGYFMRIHRVLEHPLMNNIKIFEKVVKNCAREKISTKNVECCVEEASKVHNATDKESQDNITEVHIVQKLTNASDDRGSKDSRKNVVNDQTVKTVETLQIVENGKEHEYERMHQNSTDKNNTDKTTCKKDSLNSGDPENVLKINKKANKNDQEPKGNYENNCDIRKARFSNCYVCAINFDEKEQSDHECTLRKENDVLYNCYACGVNFVNNMEHMCSLNHETWIENIQISNVVTIKDSYVFTCIECKYSTDVYDDVVKHCQNHYLEVVDAVTYCGMCKLNFDELRYGTHHNLHAKFEVVKFSYRSLFCNWDAIFDAIPRDVARELKTHTIYTTHSVRMMIVEDGPNEYSLYQCGQCKSCVPRHEIEKHCVSKCSEISYVCSVCDRAFVTYEMCANHEVTHQSGVKVFRVIAFNRTDDRKLNLKLIESRELQKKDIKSKAPTAELFQCQCDLSFVSMAKFKMHFLECNSTCRDGILCPKCPVKRNFLANELDRHLQLHHGEIIYEFVLNQINIRRSIEPNVVKCEFETTPHKSASTELDADEIKLKNELLKQEDNTIVISDDDD